MAVEFDTPEKCLTADRTREAFVFLSEIFLLFIYQDARKTGAPGHPPPGPGPHADGAASSSNITLGQGPGGSPSPSSTLLSSRGTRVHPVTPQPLPSGAASPSACGREVWPRSRSAPSRLPPGTSQHLRRMHTGHPRPLPREGWRPEPQGAGGEGLDTFSGRSCLLRGAPFCPHNDRHRSLLQLLADGHWEPPVTLAPEAAGAGEFWSPW